MSESSAVFSRRRADWRVGALVYQVFVDRFAPSRRMDGKRAHYAPPRTLHEWHELPGGLKFNEVERNHGNELQFWGGDLDSLRGKLDYLQSLHVDVLYLNPIFDAMSNHKYDANDFFRIDPQYGTMDELRALAADAHGRGMKVMLDGVFNHMGRRAPAFQRALADPGAPNRNDFYFGEEYKNGYRGWRNHANLPELNLENEATRDWLWRTPQSVVQRYLREVGIDGWRLDCGPDIGFEYLAELLECAHAARPDCSVIGECWNYPADWVRVMDGVMNMHVRTLLINVVERKMTAGSASRALDRMVADSGIEAILQSHMVIDNHDVPRIATTLPDRDDRRLFLALQFLLPGCPVLYYGSELGMEGGADPTNRAPMRWDLLHEGNEDAQFFRTLIGLRRDVPSLRVGDFRRLESDRCLAFLRVTDRALETAAVFANPSLDEVREVVPLRTSMMMDSGPMTCRLSGEHLTVHCGLAEVHLPPRSVRVFTAADWPHPGGYSLYKRVP